jgi:predicted nucleic acid-binding protein
MILVDSSVWIDYFKGTATPETDRLDSLLGQDLLATGDLMLAEVLQGFRSDADFEQARTLLTSLAVVELGGKEIGVQAARNFRKLREKGITVRKTIDTIIATRCIADGSALLFSDRDFDPFVEHLGLKSALRA